MLVEKPISVHKADCEKLLAAHTNPKQIFGAMFNQRTDPFYRKIRAMMQKGDLRLVETTGSDEVERIRAGGEKRASLHVVSGRAGLQAHDPGGIEPLTSSLDDFRARLRVENHTLKRSLTDPRLFAGIGNAYSDEILHRAKLSPMIWTARLKDEDIVRLHETTRATLTEWCSRLRAQWGEKFPAKVTAFHPAMAVHGKAKQPCPVCATPVQRIAYADNECNYGPTCQTGGKLHADRGLSPLLRGDWPKSLEEMEEWKAARRE